MLYTLLYMRLDDSFSSRTGNYLDKNEESIQNNNNNSCHGYLFSGSLGNDLPAYYITRYTNNT